ncbi:hypothetical protein FB446DRAFT_703313 [Lentinula raphanica]|nr:hypothetical protein FB446DRAFT_703313 [Lentinula raphanica]
MQTRPPCKLVEALYLFELDWQKGVLYQTLDSKGLSWDGGRGQGGGLNLRRKFEFFVGDLNESIKLVAFLHPKPRRVCTWKFEQGEVRKAFTLNPEDPDIYYHRGQVLFMMNKFDEAAENNTKSTELDDQFVFSHVQLAVAHYKAGNLASAMAQFRRTMKSFPQRGEPLEYYGAGEHLLDQQRYQDAIEKFDKATEIEEKERSHSTLFNTFVYITTLISLTLSHPGLLKTSPRQQKWTKTSVPPDDAATKHSESTQRVQQGEAAVATLAQLGLQQGPIVSDWVRSTTQSSISILKRSTELASTESQRTCFELCAIVRSSTCTVQAPPRSFQVRDNLRSQRLCTELNGPLDSGLDGQMFWGVVSKFKLQGDIQGYHYVPQCTAR